MKRFKNILLICDEGTLHEDVIGRAISLAKANDARIALVDVIHAAPGELAKIFGALAKAEMDASASGRALEDVLLEAGHATEAQIATAIQEIERVAPKQPI